MDTVTTLQHLEYMEMGFEVSKVLAQREYRMDQPVFKITWGQMAEIIAQTLADYGLPTNRLDEAFVLELAETAGQALSKELLHRGVGFDLDGVGEPAASVVYIHDAHTRSSRKERKGNS